MEEYLSRLRSAAAVSAETPIRADGDAIRLAVPVGGVTRGDQSAGDSWHAAPLIEDAVVHESIVLGYVRDAIRAEDDEIRRLGQSAKQQ